MEEKEVKFLDVDPEEIQKKLKEIGAKKIREYMFRSIVFDYPDFRLDKEAAWIRLRDDGTKTKLAFKKRLGAKTHDGKTTDTGMEEIEVTVDDFEKTAQIFRKAGLMDKFFQEKKRISWEKDGIMFEIDFWPRLKPLLEIEGKTWKDVEKGIKMLGLDPKDKKIFSATQVYALNGINDKDYIRMTFNEFVKR